MTCFNFASRIVVGLFFLSLITYSFSQEIVRPPSDDEEKSTVRVNTNWTVHSLGKAGCLDRAKTSLTEAHYFIDVNDEKGVWGLMEGRTVAIRCDYEGVAFFVVAHRRRPDQATQTKIINDLVEAFSSSRRHLQ